MKKLFVLFLVAFYSVSEAQTVFGPVEKHGFGQLQVNGYNNSIKDLKSFKGKLYASVGEDSGYVYSSTTGDLGTFTKTYSEYWVKKIQNFEVTNDNGGYFFMSTFSDGALKPEVKRSFDGINWTTYYTANDYNDEITNIRAFKGVQGFDSIYVAINVFGQSLLLRNSVTQNDPQNVSTTWDTIAGLSSAFGASGYTNASEVFNGKLYYAMDNNKLFETSDGRSVSENLNYENQVGYSSLSQVDRTSCLASFGGHLYLGTYSNLNGAQIWRTSDGVTFDSLAILNSSFAGVKSMKVAGGKLYIIVRDYSDSYELYSTADGVNFALEDNTEFGNSLTNANYSAPMEVFNGHLYVGVTQTYGGLRLIGSGNNEILDYNSDGAQIYRTCLMGPMPVVSIMEPDTNYVCAGTPFSFNATAGGASYLWNTGSIANSITVNTEGHYAVTMIELDNCRNSDDAYILNYSSPTPVVLDSYFNPVADGVVCSGDTSEVYYAANPDHDFNCIVSSGGNTGLTTPAGPSINGSDLTIEAWIYPQSVGTIVSQFDPTSNWFINDNWMVKIAGNSDEVHMNLPNVGTIFVGYVTPNQWNHIALRYNNTTTEMQGFINGTPGNIAIGMGPHAPASYWGYQDAYKFMNDAQNPNYESGMTGKIRDIRIWNIARTDSAILADKHNLPAGVYPNLMFHYETLETSGSIAADSSGNGYNANVAGVFSAPTPVTWIADPTMNTVGFNSAVFFPTQQTFYDLQYTDIHGCTVASSFKVEPAFININGTTASCGGSPAFLNFNSNISIGNPTWSSTTLGTTQTYSLNITPPSNEWVYLTDSTSGCVVIDSVLVNVGPSFISGLSFEPPISACSNTDVVLHAMASGGTAPYTILWSTGSNTDTTSVDSLVYNVGVNPALIYVSGHDAIGCYFQVGGFNGFNITPINSTDVTGHVSTPALANVDNGDVFFFKHQPGNAGFDTIGFVQLDANGRYNYLGLDAGDYLIKVMPNVTSFPNSVPTYYGNEFQWDSSLVYTHGCVQTDTADVQIVEVFGSTGTASVSGYIIEEAGFGNNRFGIGGDINNPFVPGGPLKGIDVKLGKNPGGGIQARTMTDSTGFYEFDSIPAGGYRIYVDIPNLPMDSTREITILANDSSIQNNYFADSASIYINENIVGIYASVNKYENNFSIYPNPAKDAINLNFEVKASMPVSYKIISAVGQTVFQAPAVKLMEGNNNISMNLKELNLHSGVYFITLLSDGRAYTQRIVIVD